MQLTDHQIDTPSTILQTTSPKIMRRRCVKRALDSLGSAVNLWEKAIILHYFGWCSVYLVRRKIDFGLMVGLIGKQVYTKNGCLYT